MKVLHLFSNAKWTGPAEPALNLCVALRRAGIEVDFACSPDAGRSINKVVETARERGIEPILSMQLRKYRHPIKDALDRRKLRRILEDGRYDIVHCHLDNAHRIAIAPARTCGVPLIRSSYEGLGFLKSRLQRRLAQNCAFLIEPSQIALEHDAKTFGLDRKKVCVIPGAVDTDRFDPKRPLPDGRKRLNIPAGAFVVGIVARMQRHRHFEELFAAAKLLCDKFPDVHIIVVGRGTHQETVGIQPVEKLGLKNRVHFTGYVDGDDYVGMLKALDVKVFLVPGSDGTCRAVREAMAMGKPIVAARRGMLPEIVEDGVSGFIVDGSTPTLFHALDRLKSDRMLLSRFGAEARRRAAELYSLPAQTGAVIAVYRRTLSM
jgi:glycosyltransferase involved in cell wall biosynthesis